MASIPLNRVCALAAGLSRPAAFRRDPRGTGGPRV